MVATVSSPRRRTNSRWKLEDADLARGDVRVEEVVEVGRCREGDLGLDQRRVGATGDERVVLEAERAKELDHRDIGDFEVAAVE